MSTESKPICSTCNDSHVMYYKDRRVLCTHCPRPCDECQAIGQYPYCETTPCQCECHGSKRIEPTAIEMKAARYDEIVAARDRILIDVEMSPLMKAVAFQTEVLSIIDQEL